MGRILPALTRDTIETMEVDYRPLILVVEDYPDLQQAYKTVLSSEGFDVRTAADGQTALDVAAQEEFDLILLDIVLPRLDGFGFLEAYSPTDHPETKIVIFSNMFTPEYVKKAKDLGAHRYYTKASFTPKDLAMVLREVISFPGEK